MQEIVRQDDNKLQLSISVILVLGSSEVQNSAFSLKSEF